MTDTRKFVQGYRPDEYSEKDYIFGSGQAPYPIILPSGNWRQINLIEEFQALKFETYGCVTWTILNAVEKLAKVIFNEDWNKAERFTYIASGTDPANRGNSPRTVADSIRKQGTLNELNLPFDDSIDTLEKFNSPRPLTNFLLEKGKKFLDDYSFSYDYLPQTNGQISRETLKEALKRSPVAIAVYAWTEEDNMYIRQGNDTHLTLLENVKENGELEVFDSYPPAQKTLSKDFSIYVAMRFYIERNLTPKQISIYQRILDLIGRILNITALQIQQLPVISIDQSNPPPAPPIVIVSPVYQPPEPRIFTQDEIKTIIADTAVKNGVEPQLCIAVASCENLRFPKDTFDPKRIHKNSDKVKSTDRGLFMWNDYWHPEITDEMAFDPKIATELFCQAVKQGKLKTYWSASMSCWTPRLSAQIKIKYLL